MIAITGLTVLHAMIAAAEGGFAESGLYWTISLCCVAGIALLSLVISWLWIRNLEYVVVDDRIHIHKGILTKLPKNIPLRAVTDFALECSLFDRWLGIGSIKIQTAGQSHQATGYEGVMGGLVDYDSWYTLLHERVAGLQADSGGRFGGSADLTAGKATFYSEPQREGYSEGKNENPQVSAQESRKIVELLQEISKELKTIRLAVGSQNADNEGKSESDS